MINIEHYMEQLTTLLKQQFGSKLLYIGLQGSYLRGEATQNSDIDVMVILDTLGVSELNAYRSIIESMDHSERSCGFICGKEDLANWNPLEICHLLHSTKDYYGVLREFTPAYIKQDVRNFVKLSLNNLYHEICHRYIHGNSVQNEESLPYTYKGVFFILQNLYYLTHNKFIPTKAELLQVLEGRNRDVLQRSFDLNNGLPYPFEESFELLLLWCQETLGAIS